MRVNSVAPRPACPESQARSRFPAGNDGKPLALLNGSAWVILGIDSRLSIVLHARMPRKLRIEYPGAMYHVMSRGDRREKIFLDDVEFSVQFNPVRARMLKAQERLLSYP